MRSNNKDWMGTKYYRQTLLEITTEGYLVFIYAIALLDKMTSLNDFLKALKSRKRIKTFIRKLK